MNLNSIHEWLNRRWPILYLILGPLFAIAVAIQLVPLPRFQAELVKACTAESIGTVTGYEPYNHASGVIQYSVNGTTYVTTDMGMRLSDVGTKGVVHYDPRNPARGYFGNLNFSWGAWIGQMVAVVVFITLAMVFAYFKTLERVQSGPISN